MKPKLRRFLAATLPSLIIFPAMVQTARAAIILPDGFGNVIVTIPDSGANAVKTGFGGPPPPGAHEIRIDLGAFLNPVGTDAVEIQVSDGSGATYTINNNGTLTADGAPGNHGIDTIDLAGLRPSIVVNNTGSITGASAIRANNQLTLTNTGTLSGIGAADAAVFTKNGGTINNNVGGSITGLAIGIRSELAGGTLTVNNHSSITGQNAEGIRTDGILVLSNFYEAGGPSSVNGATTGAFGAASGSQIDNYGNITGTSASGVQVGDNGRVQNHLTISPGFIPIYGGHITGGANGVIGAAGLTLNNGNLSVITGQTDAGVRSGNNANIANAIGANINGATNGVIVGDTSFVTNSGTITGNTQNGVLASLALTLNNTGIIQTTASSGVQAAAGSNLTNGGTIKGFVGVYLFNGTSTINNSGTIQGITGNAIRVSGGGSAIVNNTGLITSTGSAFVGDLGSDQLNFNLGSRVVGDLVGGGGLDVINLDGGLTAPVGAGGTASNSIRGNIDAFTTINKTGGGVAFIGIPGDSLVSVDADTIAITGGGLYINGNVDGTSVLQTTINAGGTALGGTGTWDANVNLTAGGFSAGSIPVNLDSTPSNAVGQLNLTGSVVHSAGSFIRVDVIPDAVINSGVNSDLIRQTGGTSTYNVTGANLRLSATNNNLVIRDGAYTVVDSDQALVGFGALGSIGMQYNANVNGGDTGFIGTQTSNTGTSDLNSVLTSFFTTAALADGGTNLVLNVQHNYAGLPGLTPNQAALGGALDASVASANPLVQDFIASLDYSNLATAQDALAALDPSAQLGLITTVVNSNYRLNRLAQDHLAQIRDGGETLTETSAPTTDAKGGMVPGTTSTRAGTKANVWGTASYDSQDYDAPGSAADFDGDTGSFTAGFDWKVAPELVLGIILDGSKGSFDGQGNSTDVDSFRAAVYGTWGAPTGLYSDFLVGYGDHSLEGTRVLGGGLGIASNDTDATSVQAMWTVGYTMVSGSVKHGPFAGLEYQRVEVDGSTGTGPLPISLGGYDVDSLRALIGYRVNANFGTFRPYASIAYAHEFEDGANRAAASFGGAPFSVTGAEQSSAILITAGTGISLTPSLTLDVGYRGEIATEDGLSSHGGSVGLNYSF